VKIAAPGDAGAGHVTSPRPSINTAGDVTYSAHVVGDEGSAHGLSTAPRASSCGAAGLGDRDHPAGGPARAARRTGRSSSGTSRSSTTSATCWLQVVRTQTSTPGSSSAAEVPSTRKGFRARAGRRKLQHRFPDLPRVGAGPAFNHGARGVPSRVCLLRAHGDFLSPFLLRWENGRISVVAGGRQGARGRHAAAFVDESAHEQAAESSRRRCSRTEGGAVADQLSPERIAALPPSAGVTTDGRDPCGHCPATVRVYTISPLHRRRLPGPKCARGSWRRGSSRRGAPCTSRRPSGAPP
jgi:hypothetical protein